MANFFDQFDAAPLLEPNANPLRVAQADQVQELLNRTQAQPTAPSTQTQPQQPVQPAPAPQPTIQAQPTQQTDQPVAGAVPDPNAPPTGDVFFQGTEPFPIVPGMKPLPDPAKDITPSFTTRAVRDSLAVTRDVAKGLFVESPRATLRGVLTAADSTAGALNDLGRWLDDHVGGSIAIPSTGNETLDRIGGYAIDPLKAIKDGLDAAVGYVAEPETVTGKMVEGTARFLAGFIPALRLSKAAGLSGMAADAVAGAGSAFFTTPPEEPGLANLINEFPVLRTTIGQYLATDPNDPNALNRLRHGVEMAGFGILTDGLLRGIRFAANAKKARASVDQLHAQDSAIGEQMATQLDALGNPEGPLVVVKAPIPKQGVELSPMESVGAASASALQRAATQSETGVPGQVTAKAINQPSKDRAIARSIVDQMRDPETGAIPVVTRSPEGEVSAVPVAGKQVYINLSRIETPDDVKTMMQQVADAYAPDIHAARRGVQSLEDTSQLADKIGLTVDDILARPKGQALNAEQIVAYNRVLTTSAEKLWSMAETAASPNATLAETFAFRRMLAVHHAIQMQVLGANAEAGRALSALRIARSSSGASMARQLHEVMDRLGGERTAQELAQRMLDLRAAGVGEGGINAATRRGWLAISQDMVRESFTLGLLWKPKTHMRNLVSNMVTTVQQAYERGAAGLTDQLLATPLEEAPVVSGEALAYVTGQIHAVRDLLSLGYRSMKGALRIGDETPSEAMASFRTKYPPVEVNPNSKFSDARPNAISSAAVGRDRGWSPAEIQQFASTPMGMFVDMLGMATRVPGYALGAGDFLFKTFAFAGELHATALRTAAAEGLTGQALRDRVAGLLSNPPEWLHQAAIDHALYATFNQRAGDIAQSLLRIRNYDGVVNPTFLVLTYLRTPSNILRYTANRTPLAMLSRHWREDVAAGGSRRSLALARMATGTAVMAAAMDYASSGLVTGPGPADPARREAMFNTGWRPYSFYIPGAQMYVSYNNADPLTQPFAFAAAVAEMVKASDLSPEDYDTLEERIGHAIGAVSASVIDKSYFTGIAQVANMLEESAKDRTGAVQSWMQRQASGLVPFSSLGGAINQFTDPVSREPANIWQAIMEPIPSLRQRLIPRRNVWGDEVKPQEVFGPWFEAFSPFQVTRVTDSPIDAELVRQESGIQRIPWKTSFAGVRVNFHDFPQVLDRYRVLAGNALKLPQYGNLGLRDFLNAVISRKSDYSTLYYDTGLTDGPDGGKVALIKNWVSEYREAAQEQVLDEARTHYQSFFSYVTGQQIEKMNQRLPQPGVPQ